MKTAQIVGIYSVETSVPLSVSVETLKYQHGIHICGVAELILKTAQAQSPQSPAALVSPSQLRTPRATDISKTCSDHRYHGERGERSHLLCD